MSEINALEAPELLDVSDVAREVGFPDALDEDHSLKICITPKVFIRYVLWKDADTDRQVWQEQDVRLWDILWLANYAITEGKNKFEFSVIPRDGETKDPITPTLEIKCLETPKEMIFLIQEATDQEGNK